MSHLWHPYTAYPVSGPKTTWVKAQGSYVYDKEGVAFLDATSSWWCQTVGHCHPKLVSALQDQAATLDQVMMAPHDHPVALELADSLVATLGEPFSRVFYSDDGSTAVECALKMAVQYWHNRGEKRTRFLSIESAYHGDTLGAMGVSGVDAFHHFFGSLRSQSLQSTVPYCYRCPLNKTYPSCGVACVEKGESLIEQHADELAAIIIEPLVLGAAGMIVYPPEYLERLVLQAKKSGVLVIFDEVLTGFGRTGNLFAFQSLNQQLRPDFVCLSKGLTGGMMALGATLTTETIFEAFQGGEEKKFFHGHTFTGNALACRVALEHLKVFKEERCLDRVKAMESLFREAATRLRSLPYIGNVRVLGGILASEIVQDKTTQASFSPPSGPGWKIAHALWAKKIWVRPLGNLIYLMPPYGTSHSDLLRLIESFESVLASEEPYRGRKDV